MLISGNNLESKGSVRKNKKRALKTVKGYFVWLLILRYPYPKTIFVIFRSKYNFEKKLRGKAASDYRTLISSGLFPEFIISNITENII